MSAGFEAYAELAEKSLEDERARKTTLEQKASAVIATSGTLATLLVGLVAAITAKTAFALPHDAHGFIGFAVTAFVIAGVAALLISVPVPYGEIEALSNQFLRAHWSDPAEQAVAGVTAARFEAVACARKVNKWKAWILVVAIAAEAAAIAALAYSVGIILRQAQ